MNNYQGKKQLINSTNKQQSQEKGANKNDQSADETKKDKSTSEEEEIQDQTILDGRKKLMGKYSKKNGNKEKENQNPSKSPPKKEQRTWTEGKITSKQMKKLDCSQKSEKDEAQQMRVIYVDGDQSDGLEKYFVKEGEEEEEEQKQSSGWFEKLKGKVQNYTGNKNLSEQDLIPICEELKNLLISKNVSNEISINLCNDILNKLKQTKTEKFTTINQTVRRSLQSSISQILHVNRPVDILRQAQMSKSQGKTFVITFCGVNGVGKSTNLAKIAYMLKNQGNLSILISACDTFRSGAVEQLKKHAICLQVPLFEKGYGKDPALIAQQAINFAKENQIDVVLVDTAGRMQDNHLLMQNLAKLVNVNRPDLVLFVGEALVGNDGVDQLRKFNQALIDQTDEGRGVDGIILTKFDTVDDKVGAAVSMVYAVGKPIVYVGTGQKYTHLRTLNVATVVSNLLS